MVEKKSHINANYEKHYVPEHIWQMKTDEEKKDFMKKFSKITFVATPKLIASTSQSGVRLDNFPCATCFKCILLRVSGDTPFRRGRQTYLV